MENKKGYYIMLEGGEGGGKSTQTKLLYEHFLERGYDAKITREPGGTKIGSEIRSVLLDPENKEMCSETELFLYGGDRAQHTDQIVIPSLEQGKILISDRGWPSTRNYQGVARGLDIKLINYINEVSTKGIMPDLLFILDVSPEVGLSREKEKDRFSLEKVSFAERVRKGYL
ncbi:MAG: dTMP kinase [bacterium]